MNLRGIARPAGPSALALLALLGTGCERSTTSGKTPAVMVRVAKTKTGEMALVPGGWFSMGSPSGEADEQPVRKVWVDAFLMDRYEVTQGQFKKVSKRFDPSEFKGPKLPVQNITWPEAALFCNARSRAEGLDPCYNERTAECNFEANGYRLPTEAEWEYACRAGRDSEYFFGDDPRALADYAWFRDNSGKHAHPVGARKANPWGLYDMYGNVAEWCNDGYDPGYYKSDVVKNPRGPAGSHTAESVVLRGGAWNTSAATCRSAYRLGEDPGQIGGCFSRGDIGFRCVRKAPGSVAAK